MDLFGIFSYEEEMKQNKTLETCRFGLKMVPTSANELLRVLGISGWNLKALSSSLSPTHENDK